MTVDNNIAVFVSIYSTSCRCLWINQLKCTFSFWKTGFTIEKITLKIYSDCGTSYLEKKDTQEVSYVLCVLDPSPLTCSGGYPVTTPSPIAPTFSLSLLLAARMLRVPPYRFFPLTRPLVLWLLSWVSSLFVKHLQRAAHMLCL